MKFYNLSINEVLKTLNSNKDGLSFKEANKRLEKNGKNKILEKKQKSKIVSFFSEFKDIMIIILLIAATLSFILSIINKEPYTDSIIIIFIVILNAVIGFIQSYKADKAIEALKNMQVKTIKVKREGQVFVINSEDIVKGDIIILEAGDIIPADARIISQSSLKVNEAALTGESIDIEKTSDSIKNEVPIQGRKNMIFTGTHITYGKCTAIVCETGMNTEFGLIAECLNENKKEITPLEKKINGISKFLSIIIMSIIVFMFIIGLIKGINIKEIMMLSISLAVAAIPEGLPAVITITLSLGVSALASKKAIVRKMSSIETLGCTDVICSDKTGTITQNKMEIKEIFFDNKVSDPSELYKNNILFQAMILNNDSSKNNKKKYIGDPTEIALYRCCEKYMNIKAVRTANKRFAELPFDSDRKLMSTININDNKLRIYTKGSFDSLIKHCSFYYENGVVCKLDNKKKEELKNIEIEESNKSYRVIAFAYNELDNDFTLDSLVEDNLIFIGMTSITDPPRSDVKDAIEECINAHIKPVMITGDSLSTATSIAKEIGILKHRNEAILGSEVDKLSDKKLKDKVNDYSVYARVSPANKVSIVNAWKANDKIVAMTGDGVNDAPALKNANIGIGMGITGTDVAKSVSDIILADDSFSTIVTAIKEGRRIFDNIRNVLVYLLVGNITEIIVVFIGMLFGIEVFLPIQLLYINLISDSIPAIALSFEKADSNIMKRNVRKDNTFFTPFILSKILLASVFKAIAILIVYYINLKMYDASVATSMAFLTLILIEILFAYSCKNLKKGVINSSIVNNPYMNKSILMLIIIQIIVFITPIKNIFNIVDLSILQVVYCIIISSITFLIDEIFKKAIKNHFRD